MKRFLFLLCTAVLALSCVAPCTGAVTYDQAYYARQKVYLGAGNFNDPLWNFWGELEGYLGAEGTGNTYYVDSNVSVEGDGTSWTNAKNTLDEAVALCTANNGDVIEVAQGHNEALTAADAVDLDVAGITVVGMGTGSNRPRFDFDHADGEFVIGAAGVKIRNLTFLPSVTDITHSVDVENGGDWAVIEDCEFLEGETAGTDEFTDCIQVGTTATNATIRYNVYTSIAATTVPNNFVDLSAATISNPMVYGNVVKGRFAEAGIWAGAAVPTDCYIVANTVWNVTASQFCIEFQGAATGICAYNICHAATADFEIDPGSMDRWFNGEGTIFPEQVSIYDVTGGFSGDGGANQDDSVKASLDLAHTDLDAILADTAAMDTEAEWADLSSTVVDNIVAAMDANSTLATVLADTAAMDTAGEMQTLAGTAAVSTTGVTSAPTANTLADTLHKDGSFTYDNTTDSLEAIRDRVDTLNTADQVDLDAILADTSAMDTEAEWADLGSTLVDNIVAAMDANSTDLAILNDLAGISQVGDKVVADMDANSLLYWQERTVSQTATNNCTSDDLFDVAGGNILITNFVAIVTEAVDSNVATLKIMVDRDDTAADTDFTTAVAVDTDVLGTVYVFTDANPAVLTPLTPGSVGSSTLMSPWFCPEGMIESVFSAVNLDGQIRYFLTWRPLGAGITVTAQ